MTTASPLSAGEMIISLSIVSLSRLFFLVRIGFRAVAGKKSLFEIELTCLYCAF